MQGLGSAFEIREATPADADAVEGYHHGCFTKTYSSKLLSGEFEAPDPAGTRQQLHDWFLPESEFETRVAVVDGAPIGHFTVSGDQLVHLFVEPGHQGTGLGRHLLGQAEAMIAAGGHTDFELHARVDNLAAIVAMARVVPIATLRSVSPRGGGGAPGVQVRSCQWAARM